MALTKIYDIAYQVTADGVNVEQSAGCGEVSMVTLHPIHVRLLASELGLSTGDAGAWQRVETLERRLEALRDRFATLHDRLWSVPTVPPGMNAEDPICIYADCLLEIADEYCSDIPYFTGAQTEPTANPAATQGQPGGNPQETGSVRPAFKLEGH